MNGRVASVIAARDGVRPPPLVHLGVQGRDVRRQRERAEVAEPRKPHGEVAEPVVEGGEQRALDLVEVPAGIMH